MQEKLKQKIVYGIHGAPRVLTSQNIPNIPSRNINDRHQGFGETRSVQSSHQGQTGNAENKLNYARSNGNPSVASFNSDFGPNLIPTINSRLTIGSNNSQDGNHYYTMSQNNFKTN